MKKIYSILFCSVLALSFSLNASAAEEALLIYYNFESGVEGDSLLVDLSGNGNDAYINCDSCWASNPSFTNASTCLSFNGHKAELPTENLGMTIEEGTVAFWFLMPASSDDINFIWWAGEGTTGNGFGSESEMTVHSEKEGSPWAGGELSFFIRDSIAETTYFIYSDPSSDSLMQDPTDDVVQVKDSVWHHAVATWEYGTQTLYVDGVKVMENDDYEPENIWDLNYMTIGTANTETGRVFVGLLDEFRLYNYVFSSSDVTELYNFDPTSVSEVTNSSISVFPNPASDVVKIKAESNIAVTLHDVTGKLVYSESFANNEVEVNLSSLTQGIYVCTVITNTGTSTQRIVIE